MEREKTESIDLIVLHRTEVRDTHSRTKRTEKTESNSIQFIIETLDFLLLLDSLSLHLR